MDRSSLRGLLVVRRLLVCRGWCFVRTVQTVATEVAPVDLQLVNVRGLFAIELIGHVATIAQTLVY